MQKIYLISGTLGAGKTTTTKELSRIIDNSVLIEGDMYFHKDQDKLSFEERVKKSWQKILDLTKGYLKKDLNVVIDFVVEEELRWFCQKFKDKDVEIKYVVLIADRATLTKRLEQRDALKYLDRSLFLLDKLMIDSANKGHIVDTTNKKVEDTVKEIISSSKFIVK
jgi:broad-specificity NMP kinase